MAKSQLGWGLLGSGKTVQKMSDPPGKPWCVRARMCTYVCAHVCVCTRVGERDNQVESVSTDELGHRMTSEARSASLLASVSLAVT